MMLTAITRAVSPNLEACELTFLSRQRIDPAQARAQQQAYEQCLAHLGARVISLPAEPELPDAAFVEDLAVVVDEAAVIAQPGAASRRRETPSLIPILSAYRPLKFLDGAATLEGGDVMRVDRRLYVGASARTNREGIAQLRRLLEPDGYQVIAVEVTGCLHLKTGCSYLGRSTLLINRAWVESAPLAGFELIEVPPAEPWAANALVIGETVLLPAAFPRARALLERRGFEVRTLDISEFQKAEAGLTCLSLIFESGPEAGKQPTAGETRIEQA
jgi:dimethylargininase